MRLIDAHETNMQIVSLYNNETDKAVKSLLRQVMEIIQKAPTIAPLPNDPLTLEELREMDGEPVWLVGVSSINNFRGHWDICNLGGDSPAFPYCGENPDINLYGIMWKAYRRKPEEVSEK